MVCSIPPRYDPDIPPPVDEAQGLRAAYDRALVACGTTSVGRAIDADSVPAALEVLHQWATGASWEEFDLSGKNTITVSHDIRTYYEEAAMGLVTGSTPGGRAAEAWFFEGTEAGRTIMAARTAPRSAARVPAAAFECVMRMLSSCSSRSKKVRRLIYGIDLCKKIFVHFVNRCPLWPL